ncbi:complement control protein [Colobine gammaherpesvirus 1]|uniref:Complement control protein n=1 Tax=Colobine gammaherpesvirus 1 TaxID=2597325 RepID=A0A5B8FKF4_9GAMA|nr:complement control protein [Colobine gammaherpesvirus 1]QDQ69212.1 complement control protein [Colobine gammaherpesvirus 1]
MRGMVILVTMFGRVAFTQMISNAEHCSMPRFREYKVKNSKQDRANIGESVELTCRLGYMTTAKEIKITCLVDGTWSVPTATCNKRSCPNPGELPNGHIIISDGPDALKYGANITYVCDTGYFLIGEELTSFCMLGASGEMTWSSSPPICEKEKCTKPTIDNGSFLPLKEFYEYNDAISFTCNSGFTLIGSPTTACTSDDEWTEPIPTCEITGCSFPFIRNGYIKTGHSRKFDHTDSITVACNDGFLLQGSKMSTCIKTEWKPSLAKCTASLEPTPKPQPDGNVKVTPGNTLEDNTSRVYPPHFPEVQTTPGTDVLNGIQNPDIHPTADEGRPPAQDILVITTPSQAGTDPETHSHIITGPTLSTVGPPGLTTMALQSPLPPSKHTTPHTSDGSTGISSSNFPTHESVPTEIFTSTFPTQESVPSAAQTDTTPTKHVTTPALGQTMVPTSKNVHTISSTQSFVTPIADISQPTTGRTTYITSHINISLSSTDPGTVTQKTGQPTHPPIFRSPPFNIRSLEKHMVIGVFSLVAVSCGLITLIHYICFR